LNLPFPRLLPATLPAALLSAVFSAGQVSADPLQPNQTLGLGQGKLLTFTYTQNFSCLHEPGADLNYNGVPAQSDPGEFQTPICQAVTEPSIDPTGTAIANSEPLYVLVPMFSMDNDRNPNDAIPCAVDARPGTLCGPALGSTLIKLFGAIPEAYKTRPLVYTQCPEPGAAAGTCTMHTSTIDLGKALVALGKLPPPAANIFLPTPNHSHIVNDDAINDPAIWWEVRPVLVMNAADWPSRDGGTGINSAKAMNAAEQRGEAIEVPSNFFLFFKSQAHSHMHHRDPVVAR